MVRTIGALALLALASLPPAVQWSERQSGVTARLRGVSAISDRVAWASGAAGTILRTADGGATWQQVTIPDTGSLDFRDIDAVDERTAYVLSIGPGDASRIYKTTDAGARWTLQFTNDDPKAFFDAMAFWDAGRGIAVSDSVDGRFVVIVTADGGKTWARVPPDALPPALPNEGAFAASGTNVAVLPPAHVWIGTGAAAKARVLRSSDAGKTWTVSDTPLHSSASAGIFSVAFRDPSHGIVVGGDYKQEREPTRNAATTADGGATWTAVEGLSGFRSAVTYLPRRGNPALLAVGPAGTDLSLNDGRARTWRVFDGPGYHAVSIAKHGAVAYAVGEQGRIATAAVGMR
ncbi:MAG: oxidoreductase [Acidobacteria bacterium]|nr:oxidoreductase [Acidobacteriota bacterium]